MIVSCLSLLKQFYSQTKFGEDSKYFAGYAIQINRGLKQSNPLVRKEAESLFRLMYSFFGESYTKQLKDQKPQMLVKLVSDFKPQ